MTPASRFSRRKKSGITQLDGIERTVPVKLQSKEEVGRGNTVCNASFNDDLRLVCANCGVLDEDFLDVIQGEHSPDTLFGPDRR